MIWLTVGVVAGLICFGWEMFRLSQLAQSQHELEGRDDADADEQDH